MTIFKTAKSFFEPFFAGYKWYRKWRGGTWYYVGMLVDCGMTKIFYWTNNQPDNFFEQIRETEEY